MRTIHRFSLTSVAAIVVVVSVIGIGGCRSAGNDAIATAQVAVRANPALELVATDAQQAVLTVRIRQTGRVITVKADDVVAGTAFRDLDLTAAPPVAAAPPAPAAVPAPPASASAPAPVASSSPPPAVTPVVTPAPAPARTPAPDAPTVRPERSPSPAAPQAASEGATLNEATLKTRATPVQCGGVESLHLDGIRLEAERVAVHAIGECRVRITNSHVKGRIAVQAMGAATVTIENSLIEGQTAIQATGTSVSTVSASTVQGRVQKLQQGVVRDLGKNVWR